MKRFHERQAQEQEQAATPPTPATPAASPTTTAPSTAQEVPIPAGTPALGVRTNQNAPEPAAPSPGPVGGLTGPLNAPASGGGTAIEKINRVLGPSGERIEALGSNVLQR